MTKFKFYISQVQDGGNYKYCRTYYERLNINLILSQIDMTKTVKEKVGDPSATLRTKLKFLKYSG